MRRLLTSLLLASASLWAADAIPTAAGDVTLTPLGHASVQFEFQGKTWYVDPWSHATDYASKPKADVILITDIHGDHRTCRKLTAPSRSGYFENGVR